MSTPPIAAVDVMKALAGKLNAPRVNVLRRRRGAPITTTLEFESKDGTTLFQVLPTILTRNW
jgi:hypothetical protein